jgi:hypothetical protein
MDKVTHPCEPVGLIDMAARLGVDDRTPQQWHHRGQLPPADWPSVSGRSAWCWPHTVKPWAEAVKNYSEICGGIRKTAEMLSKGKS